MIDENIPAWLNEEETKSVTNSGHHDNQGKKDEIDENTSGVSQHSMLTNERQELDQTLANTILFLRFANMGVSIALITEAILTIIRLPAISKWVLALYAFCSGILVFLQETQLKFLRIIIGTRFGFLFNASLRFFFYLLMASVSLSFSDLFGTIVAGLLVSVAFYNSYVIFRYPDYYKMHNNFSE